MLYKIFSSELFWASLKWLIIAIVWGVLTFGIYRKDHPEKERLNDRLDPAGMIDHLKRLHKRNTQLWALLTLLMIAGAATDLHHTAEMPAAPVIVMESKSPSPPVTAVVNTEKTVALPASSSPLPFIDITEFNEKDSKEQAYIDVLKRRYEAWLVTYYYLQKCGKSGAQDLDIIRNSLKKELREVHAESSIEENIMMAATGSYKEMYSTIPCDSAHLTMTQSTYDMNIKQLQQFAQPAQH